MKPGFAVRTTWLVKLSIGLFKSAVTLLKSLASILNSFWAVANVIGLAEASSNKITSVISFTVVSSFLDKLNSVESKVLVPSSKTKPLFAFKTIWYCWKWFCKCKGYFKKY